VKLLAAEPDAAFTLAPDAMIEWAGVKVARLLPGDRMLSPRIEPLPADFFDGSLRDEVRRRLERAVGNLIATVFHPLAAPVEGLTAPARGLLFRLAESLGSMPATEAASLVRDLGAADRKRLGRLGVRFGTVTIYIDRLLKPGAVGLRALLWSVAARQAPPAPPPAGAVSTTATAEQARFFEAIGYRVAGGRAIRVDRLETLAARLRKLAAAGPVTLDAALAAVVSVPLSDLPPVVRALGYKAQGIDGATVFVPAARRRQDGERPTPPSDEHPFSKLAGIAFAR
jgi:ATP-dependent RNA helicase SUPV3L1/SUV3